MDKTIHDSRTDREKYAVTEAFYNPGKVLLIIGALGNWGQHVAFGMPEAAGVDLILSDREERAFELDALREEVREFYPGISVKTITYTADEEAGPPELFRLLRKKAGTVDVLADLRAINDRGKGGAE